MSDVKTARRTSRKGPVSAPSARGRQADSLPVGALKGCGIGLLALFLLLAVFAGIAAGCDNPGILYLPFSLCALYLGAVTAGFASARLTARLSGRSFMSGLSAGGIYAAAVFLLSLTPLPSSGLPASVYWVLLLTVIPAAALGSIMGQKKKVKPSYRR